MKCIIVAGARPNFIKVAPIIQALRARGHEFVLVHTGQHYDPAMSDAFFTDLGLPEPQFHLEVGSGSQAEQTARVMERFDPVLVKVRPDWVVVVGDVNSTLAAALVTAKRRAELGTGLVHVEAGLRSGDRAMPEEVNRVITDRLSDLLLTHSPEAEEHLRREGIAGPQVQFVGNVMMDALFAMRERHPEDAPWERFGVPRGGYGLVTLHRPSNVDDPGRLAQILAGLTNVANDLPLIWPVHPRTRARLASSEWTTAPGLLVVEPLGYREMTALVDGAAVVITDSGGLQEETTALGVPCVTLRENTERPVTVTDGTNRLVWPPEVEAVGAAVKAARASGRGEGSRSGRPVGWDGQASIRVVEAMEGRGQAPVAPVLPPRAGYQENPS